MMTILPNFADIIVEEMLYRQDAVKCSVAKAGNLNINFWPGFNTFNSSTPGLTCCTVGFVSQAGVF